MQNDLFKVWLLVMSLSLICCQKGEKVSSEPPNGEGLAKTYCAACHTYPTPALLDRASWADYMLPRMGHMLGMYGDSMNRNKLVDMDFGGDSEAAKVIYPTKPALTSEEWSAIQNFYLSMAPDELTLPTTAEIQTEGLPFEVIKPKYMLQPPSTTMVQWGQDDVIYIGDAHTQQLVVLDESLAFIKAGKVREGAVWLEEIDDDLWITVMGNFAPSDDKNGLVIRLPKDGDGQARIIGDQLNRPVHTAYGDLNADGHMDIVICEFGKWNGQLSALVADGRGQYEHHIIHRQTGPIRSYLRDMDDDGRLDIVTLFGQGDEGIKVFLNQGEMTFKAKDLVECSPSHGSTFFVLYDMDGDGDEDIIYTAGDNADFKPILKPYHGVYVFENKGDLIYEQVLFEPMHGAYAALPADYDLDGDIDIAAISFFPDYSTGGRESFIYFELQASGGYTRKSFADVTMGRWIVMDQSDFDDDGDVDLLLGSLAFEVVPRGGYVDRWMAEGLPFVVLENTTR